MSGAGGRAPSPFPPVSPAGEEVPVGAASARSPGAASPGHPPRGPAARPRRIAAGGGGRGARGAPSGKVPRGERAPSSPGSVAWPLPDGRSGVHRSLLGGWGAGGGSLGRAKSQLHALAREGGCPLGSSNPQLAPKSVPKFKARVPITSFSLAQAQTPCACTRAPETNCNEK